MQRLLPGAGHGISCFDVHPQLLAYAEKASPGGLQCAVMSWQIDGAKRRAAVLHQAPGAEMKHRQLHYFIQAQPLLALSHGDMLSIQAAVLQEWRQPHCPKLGAGG